MKLTQLSLINFRCFAGLTIAPSEHLTVLVAPNGQGKTAVLDAIRIALWPYVSAFDVVSGTMTGSGIDIDDVMMRPTGSTAVHNMEPQLPSVISAGAIIAERRVNWSRSRERVSRGSKTTIKQAKPLMEIGSEYQSRIRVRSEHDVEQSSLDLKLPIIAYYGTGRLWKRRKLTSQRKTRSDIFSRTYAYLGCLDSASDYGSFLDWFFFNFAADFEQRAKSAERDGFYGLLDANTPYSEILAAVSGSVDLIMNGSGWTDLRYSPSNQALVMLHPKFGELKVDQLSDGQRNMVAMAGDIAYRCVRLNPHLAARAPLETEGIVLIDEVDMHLHPQWQQLVIGSLREAFPRIQFILTTHSPQVISTVPAESIRILSQSGDQIPRQQTKGATSSSVLSSIFGTDPTPNVLESELFSQYLARIQQGSHASSEGRALRERLVQHFGAEHPVMHEADRMIRLEEFKRRLPSPTTQPEG